MEIQLDGLANMIATLKKAQQDISGPGVRKAIAKGAAVVADAMRDRAPLLDKKTPGSNSLEPGALKAGIRSYVVKDADPPEALAGPGKRTAHVARFVEYGHRQISGGSLKLLGDGRTRGSGKASGEDVPAHPFLRPAFEDSVTACGEAIKVSLSETFRKAVS